MWFLSVCIWCLQAETLFNVIWQIDDLHVILEIVLDLGIKNIIIFLTNLERALRIGQLRLVFTISAKYFWREFIKLHLIISTVYTNSLFS